jgi:hypothetical protein
MQANTMNGMNVGDSGPGKALSFNAGGGRACLREFNTP